MVISFPKIRPVPRLIRLRNKVLFYGELSAPRPTPKLEDSPLSAVRDCLFNIFAATLHPQPEDAPCRGFLRIFVTLGRSRRRWVDNIKMDLREIGWDGMDWIDLAQNRDQ
jgi:hypothetical protein